MKKSLFVITIAIMIFSIAICSCGNESDSIFSEENKYQNAVAQAAIKTMNQSNLEIISEPLPIDIITYAFTDVSIDNAFEFCVDSSVKTKNFVNQKCGNSKLRVIIANFTLFDNELPLLGDTIIVVIGNKGTLHCLSNSINVMDGSTDFSMHKTLDGATIIKDEKYKGYTLIIETTLFTGGYNLAVSDKNTGTSNYTYVKDSYKESSLSKLYKLEDLL